MSEPQNAILTPYAFHDGTVGLYLMGFCKSQAPMRERMEAIYGMNGQRLLGGA